jgi:hypothetical protein
MKKSFVLFTAFLGAIVLSQLQSVAQGFEGTIEFRKIGTVDTIKYVYHVKGNNVRIDEIGSDKKTAGTMLIDIKNQTAKSLSPERKLYLDVEKGKANTLTSDQVSISKGKNSKTIAGYKCSEVVVTNNEQKTVVTYYMAKDNFHFLNGVIKTLNRKDKASVYYQTLSDTENSFPLMSVETDLAGNKKSVLEVLSVNKQKIDDKTFVIPPGYKKFEK